MVVDDYGYGLIKKDLRRLKKHKSLKDDLSVYYDYHSNILNEQG